MSALSGERLTTRFLVVVVFRRRRASFQRRSNSPSSPKKGVGPGRGSVEAETVGLLRVSGLRVGSDERLLSLVSDEAPTDPRGVKASSNIRSNESHLNDANAFLLDVDVLVVMVGVRAMGGEQNRK